MDKEKYLKIIKKLKLDKPEKITEEQSNEIVKDYLSWNQYIWRLNKLYLNDKK